MRTSKCYKKLERFFENDVSVRTSVKGDGRVNFGGRLLWTVP